MYFDLMAHINSEYNHLDFKRLILKLKSIIRFKLMLPGDSDHKYYKLAYNDDNAKTGLGFYYGAAESALFVVKKGLA